MADKLQHKTSTLNSSLVKGGISDSPMAIIKEWPAIMEMSKALIESGFVPSEVRTVPQTAAIILKGVELGLKPMQSLSEIYVIKGNAGLAANLQRALILSRLPGAKFNVIEMNNEICTIEASRPGHIPQRFSYTYKEASKIVMKTSKGGNYPLVNKDNWKNHTTDMLFARCTGRVWKAMFSDLGLGIVYTKEELMDEAESWKTDKEFEGEIGNIKETEVIEKTKTESYGKKFEKLKKKLIKHFKDEEKALDWVFEHTQKTNEETGKVVREGLHDWMELKTIPQITYLDNKFDEWINSLNEEPKEESKPKENNLKLEKETIPEKDISDQ